MYVERVQVLKVVSRRFDNVGVDWERIWMWYRGSFRNMFLAWLLRSGKAALWKYCSMAIHGARVHTEYACGESDERDAFEK